MPVILAKDDERAWINPGTALDQALEILALQFPADAMEAYEVSKKVNTPGRDVSDLLHPI